MILFIFAEIIYTSTQYRCKKKKVLQKDNYIYIYIYLFIYIFDIHTKMYRISTLLLASPSYHFFSHTIRMVL